MANRLAKEGGCMNRLLIIVLAALTAPAGAGAQTYKWVDERGVTHYGEKPPAGQPARTVETRPGGVVETGGYLQEKLEAERRRQAQEPARPQPATVPPPAPVRGMDFATFIQLQRGMTEGELLLRAGRPDHESIENIRHDIVKTYYYFPTVSDPYTTVVTLRGGRILNLERIRKF
jgi:hypothetical protein